MSFHDVQSALAAFAFLLGFAVATPDAPAQVHVGPQVSLAEDTDLGLGGRVAVFDLGEADELDNWEGVGTFDLFFPGDDVDYWEVNFNGLYNFDLGGGTPLFPYLGGGLNVSRASVGDRGTSDTDVGLNALAGWKYEADALTPFGEVRLELGGGEQIVVTGGLLFP